MTLKKTTAPLIALEGIDGAGTTTQARQLTEWLQHVGIAAHLTCEPSDGPIGKMIRSVLGGDMGADRSCLALLFAADRLHHLSTEVATALESGSWVVTDRYVYSSLAYQSLDLDPSWVAEINREAPDADLTFYLKVDPDVALERVARRSGRTEIFETIAQQRRIAAIYDEIFDQPHLESRLPSSRVPGGAGSRPTCEDPPRSLEIQPDPVRGSSVLGERSPRVVVVDGAAATNTVRDDIRAHVEKFAAHLGIWDVP